MTKKTKMALCIGVVIVAIGLLFFQGFQANGGMGVYLTIEEALTTYQTDQDKFIQMEGKVDPKSVSYDSGRPLLVFNILDDKKNMVKVEYKDIKPDNFDAGYPVIVEGKFVRPGEFQADKLK
ncbi:MAG: cytochrome c maturation protein CcmE, partial [Firmicutes bacterium]|nr:cytochrome c maturation protein CcmE [Bacillota bacterium]